MKDDLKSKNQVCNITIEDGFEKFNESLIRAYKGKKKEKIFNDKLDNDNDKLDNDNEEVTINNIYDKVLIITDKNVYSKQYDSIIKNVDHNYIFNYLIEAGEESKSIKVYEEVMNFCKEIGLTRKSVVFALGGGVVGDLAGFIASTYMRGIDVIQIPTSLLSQVDSSIGGKTGINLGSFKNIIGTFYMPKLTYINVNTLATLPKDEFINGMAEVIKYGLIYDIEIIDYLIDNYSEILNRSLKELNYIVNKCAMIKSEIVTKDEKESGIRKILNFGHTFGHGVEKICRISHGEAVSIGMNMALKFSLQRGFVDDDYYRKFITVSKKYNLPTEYSGADEKDVYQIMKSDKKNSFGKLNLILPVGIGKVEEFTQDYISIEKDILEIISTCRID